MSDPVLEAWWDLEVETENHSWKLTAVNGARVRGLPTKTC